MTDVMETEQKAGVVLGIFDVLEYAPSQEWEYRVAEAGCESNDPDEVWSRLFELVWGTEGYAELRDSIGAEGIREPVRVTREPHWHVIDGVRRIVAAAHFRADVPVVIEE